MRYVMIKKDDRNTYHQIEIIILTKIKVVHAVCHKNIKEQFQTEIAIFLIKHSCAVGTNNIFIN